MAHRSGFNNHRVRANAEAGQRFCGAGQRGVVYWIELFVGLLIRNLHWLRFDKMTVTATDRKLLLIIFVGLTGLVPVAAADDAPLVTRRTITAVSNGKREVMAEKGEIVQPIQTRKGSVLIETSGGKRGWVSKRYLVSFKDSAGVFDELIRAKPRDTNLYLMRASVWAERGDYERAIADCGRAIKIDPDLADAYVNRGVYYASAGDYEKAIANYTAAIKLGATDHDVFVNRAIAHASNKNFDRAIADIDEILRQDPKNADYYVRRGVIWRQKEDWDAAIADFTKALELDAKNLAALSSRGFVYYLKGDHKKAVADFDRQIRLEPENAMAYNNRGFNRQMIGQYAQALADYNDAIRLDPEYAMALQNKAWLLATCPDAKVRDGRAAFEAAKSVCQRRRMKVAGDIKALAASYAELSDFKHAIQYQSMVVEMTEGDAKTEEQEILKLYEAGEPFRFSVAGAAR